MKQLNRVPTVTHTIYIVDDSVSVREALIMLIEEEPDLAICGAVDTAVEALEVILRLQPDLVLTDYSLPGMSGVELIERLGILKPEQQVAVLSAHTTLSVLIRPSRQVPRAIS